MENQNPAPRRVPSDKIRGILNELADAVCAAQDNVGLSMTGNTFNIHLEGATLNITIFEPKGGNNARI